LPIRQPIVVVLGHVDHGKTTLLDRIRGTAVAAREPGAISQHIGASFVPAQVLADICRGLLEVFRFKIDIPGLLFIDTPGHSAFSNLRRRGGSVADIAILVIDLMEGVKPQTAESIDILKARKTPFVVAANKLDMVPGWRSTEGGSFLESVKKMGLPVVKVLDEKIYFIVGSLAEFKLSGERFDRVRDFRKNVAIVPVSAKTGEGLPDLLTVLVGLTQQYMKERLVVSEGGACGTILEVKEDPGLGVNVNTIIYDGVLRENDTLVVGGKQKVFTTKVRAILVPKPLDEIRDPREKFLKIKEVPAAAGVKIVAPGLEEALPGSPLYALSEDSTPEQLVSKVREEIEGVRISTDKVGVVLKADTLGSLEALVGELESSNIPVRLADVGDISRRDVVEAEVVKAEEPAYGVVLGFNVKVLPDAAEEASKRGVLIFQNNVIYGLLEEYLEWMGSLKERETRKALESLWRPAKLKVLKGLVFRRSKPAIFGVEVLAGTVKSGSPIIRANGVEVGKIVQIQDKGETIPQASKGMQVAVSMKEPTVGRHIREEDILYVDVPESHVKLLRSEYQNILSRDEIECLNEFVEIKRKTAPYFAFGT